MSTIEHETGEPDPGRAADPPVRGGTHEVSRVLEQVLDEAAPAPVLRPVRIATAAEEIADRLITAVAVGEFLPGDRLPVERELAQMLGVSRPSVREAISRLQAAGIVRIRRGRLGGAFVCESWTEASAAAVRRTLLPRWDELEQLFDLRGLVEEMVARTAAIRRKDEHVEQIRAALSRYAAARTVRDEHVADTAFHQAVLDATGNPQIVALSRDLLTRVTLGLAIEPWDDDPGVYERTMREHTMLGEAIIAGEVERAGEIAREHFTITAHTLRDALSRGMAAERRETAE